MLEIRTANESDRESVLNFYRSLIEKVQNFEYRPYWEWGVYPAIDFLLNSIGRKELYIGEKDGAIVSCMVVNHEYNDGYNKIRWSVEAADDELLVIHALGVEPDLFGRGIAKLMVQSVFETARANNIKTVRLDVLEGNIPAEKAYISLGFKHIDTIPMYYEDTGWTSFKAYEYPISE